MQFKYTCENQCTYDVRCVLLEYQNQNCILFAFQNGVTLISNTDLRNINFQYEGSYESIIAIKQQSRSY